MKDDDIKKRLSEEEYRVTQHGGTETPFENKYWDNREDGTYRCLVCGQKLFESNTKLDTSIGPMGLRGWPAFENAVEGSVAYKEDNSGGMSRTEVVCSSCGSHLGHIFDDPHSPSGKHFCVNSCSLDFDQKADK